MALFDKMKRKPERRKNKARSCLAAVLTTLLLGSALCGCRASAPKQESSPEPAVKAETKAAQETEATPGQAQPCTASSVFIKRRFIENLWLTNVMIP